VKLVMTLLVRDEADVVEANLAYHLNAGVDLVIATDHDSRDGTGEILERYVSEGHVRLIRETKGGFRQSELVTRMARMAATDYAADWVLNCDADEFWWPRGDNLKEVLGEIPAEYGIVLACMRQFVPRVAPGAHFAEAMTVRFAPPATFFDPLSTYRPVSKVVHRADPRVTVGTGNHSVAGARLLPILRGWYPIEVLHFPWRSAEQVERKAGIQAESTNKMRKPPPGFSTVDDGASGERFSSLALDEDEVERGLAEGTLAMDTRVRDALRALARVERLPPEPEFPRLTDVPALAFPRPSLVEDAAYAVDTAVLAETEVLRAQKRLDRLERRVAELESGLIPRLSVRARRAARYAKRAGSRWR
jgi:hypothetical protein